jgi:hypothetical protein
VWIGFFVRPRGSSCGPRVAPSVAPRLAPPNRFFVRLRCAMTSPEADRGVDLTTGALMRRFVLLVDGRPTDDQLHALRRRCRDATPAEGACRDRPPGLFPVSFKRRAPSLIDAIVSAIRDLESVGLSAVRALEHDHLVSLAEVARRTGRSRREVARWAREQSGSGAFPAPARDGPGGGRYRWGDVARWLGAETGRALDSDEAALTAVNLALQLRAMAPHVDRIGALRALIAG